jgi:hypothetical protein
MTTSNKFLIKTMIKCFGENKTIKLLNYKAQKCEQESKTLQVKYANTHHYFTIKMFELGNKFKNT